MFAINVKCKKERQMVTGEKDTETHTQKKRKREREREMVSQI